MFKNYINTAFRNLSRQKFYSLLNISGLAIGLTCFIFILFYVKDEINYDKYHEKADQIYRIVLKGTINNNEIEAPVAPFPMTHQLLIDYPDIVLNATRISNGGANVHFAYLDNNKSERNIFFTDSSFFNVFSAEFLKGNKKEALKKNNSIVLTESKAKEYFGKDNPIGKKVLLFGTEQYEVTGVVNDVPTNSHFKYEMLASFYPENNETLSNWALNSNKIYIELPQGYDYMSFKSQLEEMRTKYIEPQYKKMIGHDSTLFEKEGTYLEYYLQPLTDIHLKSDLEYEFEQNGSMTYIYVSIGIAFLILIIACINYMNLSTARYSSRSKEVGVRKILGANNKQIITQFLIESLFLTTLALLISMMLVEVFLPQFNELTGKNFDSNYIHDSSIIPLLIVITIIVSLISGSYPSFYLSKFQPIVVIKRRNNLRKRNLRIRSILVVVQFTVSSIIVIGTMVIFKQINFIKNQPLGYDKENIVVIKGIQDLKGKIDCYKDELINSPGIKSASLATSIPNSAYSSIGFQAKAINRMINLWISNVDENYLNTFGIKLKKGRFFDPNRLSDSNAIVINETAEKLLNAKNILGLKLSNSATSEKNLMNYEIIGVVEDHQFQSAHTVIRPMALRYGNSEFLLAIKLQNDQTKIGLESVETHWNRYFPNRPLEYSFLEESYSSQYKIEQQTAELFLSFAIIAIFIAALGLLGLISFTTEQRTKEIGMRKVLGASVHQLIYLLTKEIVVLVLFANTIAIPLSYFIMKKWLGKFAYHVNVSVDLFFIAVVSTFFIAIMTIIYQTTKVAISNPAISLRYE